MTAKEAVGIYKDGWKHTKFLGGLEYEVKIMTGRHIRGKGHTEPTQCHLSVKFHCWVD